MANEILLNLLRVAGSSVDSELELSRAVSEDVELTSLFLASSSGSGGAAAAIDGSDDSDDGGGGSGDDDNEEDVQLHSEIDAVLDRARAALTGARQSQAAQQQREAEHAQRAQQEQQVKAAADAAAAARAAPRRRPAALLPKSYCDARTAFQRSAARAEDDAARASFERYLVRWQWKERRRGATAAVPEACDIAVAWGEEQLESGEDASRVERELAQFERAVVEAIEGSVAARRRASASSQHPAQARARAEGDVEWGTPRKWLLASEVDDDSALAESDRRQQLDLACSGSLAHLMMRVDTAVAATLLPQLEALAAVAAADESDARAVARFGIVFRLAHSLLCHEGRRSCTFLHREGD